MPLDKASLKQEILRISDELASSKTDKPPAQVNAEVAEKWAGVYLKYAAAARAGPLSPVLAPSQLISGALLGLPVDFAGGLAAGLLAFWSTTFFTDGPGFIPVNPCIPFPSGPLAAQIRAFPLEKDRLAAAARITDALHIYTTSTRVTVTTTTVPPVVTVAPVT